MEKFYKININLLGNCENKNVSGVIINKI